MTEHHPDTWIAFSGTRRVAAGSPANALKTLKTFASANPEQPLLIFDAGSSRLVEIDLRAPLSELQDQLPAPAPDQPAAEAAPPATRTPGRPKLGVVAREVTLLPRHWEWLGKQPGGASVALRKLVEAAQRSSRDSDRVRAAQESAYRFMTAMAGDEPNYEEAIRALFAGDLQQLEQLIQSWPRDIGEHAGALAQACKADDR